MSDTNSCSSNRTHRNRRRIKKDETVNLLDTSMSSFEASPRMKWRIVCKKNTKKSRELPNGYLGVVQRGIAEKKLGSLKFAVYHQLPQSPLLENMKTEVYLTCVFKSSRNNFTHFPIGEHLNDNDYMEFFVDTGSSKPAKKFGSVEELIECYCRK
ncbi:unnamed protein product [Caenorhabditis brenneri]